MLSNNNVLDYYTNNKRLTECCVVQRECHSAVQPPFHWQQHSPTPGALPTYSVERETEQLSSHRCLLSACTVSTQDKW